MTFSLTDAIVASLFSNLKKTHGEVDGNLAKLYVFLMAAELATKEHIDSLATAREERQDEIEPWKATTSQREVTFAKVREISTTELGIVRCEGDKAAARHHAMVASICRDSKALEK